MLLCCQFPVSLLIVAWEPVDDKTVSQDMALAVARQRTMASSSRDFDVQYIGNARYSFLMSRKTMVLVSLLVGGAFGIMSELMIYYPVQPDWVGRLEIFLMPGYIISIIANGNVHDPSPIAAGLVNFLLYFSVAWLILKIALAKAKTR